LRKKLGVSGFGEAQILLDIFVTEVEAQGFAELNNRLRDLAPA
jgi:hypothetical protein